MNVGDLFETSNNYIFEYLSIYTPPRAHLNVQETYFHFILSNIQLSSLNSYKLYFCNSCESWLCDRNRTSSSSNSWDILEGKWSIFLSGISLSVWSLKHVGFGLRVSIETLICKVIRVSLKLLYNLNLMNKIMGDWKS